MDRRRLCTAAGVLLAAIAVTGCGTGHRARAAFAPGAQRAGPQAGSLGSLALEASDPVLSAELAWLLVDRSAQRLTAVGNRYYQLRIRDTALDYYSEAIARGKEYPLALDGRARVLRDWGFNGEALDDAMRAARGSPNSAAVVNTLGTILQALGKHDEAAVAYARAADLDRTAPYAMTNLCYLSFLGERYEAAAQACSEALWRSNTFVPARNNLALAHAAAGRADEARSHFLGGTNEAEGHYNLGIVLLAQKRYEEAAVEFHAATRKNPSFAAAHRRARQAEYSAAMKRSSSHAAR